MKQTEQKQFNKTEETLLLMNPGMETEKAIWWDKWGGVFYPTISTFYLLSNILEYDEEENEIFEKFHEESENRYEYESIEEYIESLPKSSWDFHNMTVNTYNHDSLLSDVIQYTIYVKDDEYYLFLMIHRGGDVRGNYSPYYIFKICGGYDGICSLLSDNDYTIFCSNCTAYWDMGGSYCNYHNKTVEVPNKDAVNQLETNLFGEPTPKFFKVEAHEITEYDIFDENEDSEEYEYELGIIGVFYPENSDELVVLCPCCGEKLQLDKMIS